MDLLYEWGMRDKLLVPHLGLDYWEGFLRSGSVAVRAGGALRPVAAVAVCAIALAYASAASATDSAGEPSSQAEGYVEEVIVTADRLEKGAMPTPTIMVQTYSVLQRGKRLYNARRYEEALPYLLMTAKRGFKWAQAMAADIYLHGRGGVPRDIEEGMGWLGVAARPQTAPRIQAYFRRALAEMSPGQRAHVEDVVRRYRAEWSSQDWRVSCRRTVSSSPAAMGVLSLRLNKRMHCTFVDEDPVCRPRLIGSSALNPVPWLCPPVRG